MLFLALFLSSFSLSHSSTLSSLEFKMTEFCKTFCASPIGMNGNSSKMFQNIVTAKLGPGVSLSPKPAVLFLLLTLSVKVKLLATGAAVHAPGPPTWPFLVWRWCWANHFVRWHLVIGHKLSMLYHNPGRPVLFLPDWLFHLPVKRWESPSFPTSCYKLYALVCKDTEEQTHANIQQIPDQ